MFGFGFTKLLLLAFIVLAVWQGFRYVQRREALRAGEEIQRLRREAAEAKAGNGRAVEELEACQVCGIFIPNRGATRCGRRDCPIAG